ncbi:hypothetical protein PoB_003110600 [Plakobranchus ocellatus]|uniref:Uncharacterized protein n=1 Tax=Plakobranchus ocellatus TaxID=259542 RepID=A0AAV4A061_9GAST|nr:hypothetical protein PoB_003110600 [Plakobranchus ocellatus]
MKGEEAKEEKKRGGVGGGEKWRQPFDIKVISGFQVLIRLSVDRGFEFVREVSLLISKQLRSMARPRTRISGAHSAAFAELSRPRSESTSPHFRHRD